MVLVVAMAICRRGLCFVTGVLESDFTSNVKLKMNENDADRTSGTGLSYHQHGNFNFELAMRGPL